MSNQVYQNPEEKYYNSAGNSYFTLSPATQVIPASGDAYAVLSAITIARTGLLELVGNAVVFRKRGHFTFTLNLRILVADGVGGIHPEVVCEFASNTAGQTAAIANCKADNDDLQPTSPKYMILNVSGSTFANPGDSLAVRVYNRDTGAQMTLTSASTLLTITSAY